MYNLLYNHFGPQGWWPAETPFEVMVGAILTQNTAWTNVEKCIKNLKEKGFLSPKKLYNLPTDKLSELIRPSGYFKIKAQRLKEFIRFIFKEYKGDIDKMLKEDGLILREKLLRIKGIGEETADSILLYATNKPFFVVDTYTKRICSRHGLIDGDVSYKDLQRLFTENLDLDIYLYKEFHALIVKTGKLFCKKEPECKDCPLKIQKITNQSRFFS